MTKAPADLRSLARSHTDMAMRTLSAIAKSKACPAAARTHAAIAILDRGWGRPDQPVTGSDGKSIEILVRTIVNGKD